MDYTSLFTLPRLGPSEIWNLLTQDPRETLLAFGLLGLVVLLLFLQKSVLLGPCFQFRRITLPSVLLNGYLIIMLPPSILWFLASSDPMRYTHLLAVDAVPVLFLVGVWLANSLCKSPAKALQAFLNAKLARSRHDVFFRPFITFMLLASLAVGAAYVFTAQYVPLVESIREYGALEGDSVRMSVYNLSDALIFCYALAVRLFLPFCVLYAFFAARLYGPKWRVKFWAVLALSLVMSSLSLERSPTLGLFLVLMLAYLLTSRKKHLLRYAVLLGVALLVGGLIHQAQYQLEIERSSIPDYMSNFLLNRIWLDPSYMTAVAFRAFNSSTTFLGGRSIRLLSLVGIPYESFSSVGFAGDLWANFGWPGIIVGSVLMGLVLQSIQLRAFREKTAPTLAIYVLFLVNELWLLYGSVLSTMVVTVFAAGLLLLRLLPQAGRAATPRAGIVALPAPSP